MFKQFYDDLTYLPRRKFNAKYSVPALIGFLSLVLVGQLIMINFPLNKLNRASGHIVELKISILSWSHAKYSSHDTPNYGLVISLDNGHSYNIQDQTIIYQLDENLKVGDDVVIYYPNTMLVILSANLARDVSQVERGSQILYSWKGQQNEEWFNVCLIIAAIGFFYWMKGYLQNYIEAPAFK